MTMRTYRMEFISSVAALLLAGCVTTPEGSEQVSVVRVVSNKSVHIVVSAGAVREEKTIGNTVLALPNVKVLPTVTEGKSRFKDRLAALQATVKPAVPTKAIAFATLSDGPLIGAEVKALFTGLDTLTGDGVPETHRFRHAGRVAGTLEHDPDLRSGNGTAQEDSASWEISNKSELCMNWFDWYSGDRICYRVIKHGNRIVLNSEYYSIHYEILN